MNHIEEIIDKYRDIATKICTMNLRNNEDKKCY
jgi:hypothetical protein